MDTPPRASEEPTPKQLEDQQRKDENCEEDEIRVGEGAVQEQNRKDGDSGSLLQQSGNKKL